MSRAKILLVVGILILGLILRLHNYSSYPQRGASSDEYTYSFLGLSLLTNKHVPESWSNLSAYKNRYDMTINNLYFPMVYPYFDHPPLNGLLVASWSILNGEDTFRAVDLKTIRLVPIFLAVISSILVFLIGLRLFNYKTALWALLIFSTATIFVMNQRVVFAENLLTPILLGAVYLYSTTKKMTFKKTLILALLSGLAFWTKELGVVVFFTILFLFFADKVKPKYILALSTVSILFFLGYIGYGHYYDADLFWQVVGIQSDRRIGPETLMLLTPNPVIVNKTYFDGWYLLGFLSIFITFLDYKKYKMILVPAFIYLMLMIFSLAKDGEMGWYMIPLFPFMAISTAAILVENLGKKSWAVFLLLLFVGLYQVRYLFEANFGLVPAQFRFILVFMFAPFVLVLMFNRKKIFDFLVSFSFYLLILGTIILTYNYIHPA